MYQYNYFWWKLPNLKYQHNKNYKQIICEVNKQCVEIATGARAKVREPQMLENPEYAMQYADVSPVFWCSLMKLIWRPGRKSDIRLLSNSLTFARVPVVREHYSRTRNPDSPCWFHTEHARCGVIGSGRSCCSRRCAACKSRRTPERCRQKIVQKQTSVASEKNPQIVLSYKKTFKKT